MSRPLLTRIVLILLSVFTSVTLTFGKRKPNIILILADDLGYETLGCNGNDDKLTPNLDALAAGGMRFDSCYATPLCTPSRVQLMTGKYNNRNYIGFGLLKQGEKTFGHLMKGLGYRTCIAGKWQLYGNEKQFKLAGGLKGSYPYEAGFDNFCLWQVDQLGSRYKDPTVYTDDRKSVTLPGKFGDDVFASYIEQFIEKNRNEPFFVYYPMCLTHDPFIPTPDSKDYLLTKPKTSNPQYFKDMLAYMDKTVARIVNKVKALNLDEETVIIFTGDNGTSPLITSRFRGGLRKGNKGQTDERGTHVPMIVNWKGVTKPGSVNNSLIDFTDFYPTLAELAGGRAPKLDGMSFSKQLEGEFTVKRDWVFCHYDPHWGPFKARTFVHNKEWKLYLTGEVFHLTEDPDELKPLKKEQLAAADQQVIRRFEQIIAEKMKNGSKLN